jgi:hypothetical protein
MKRTDDKVQLVAFCVNSFCVECAKENFQHGHVNCCPLRRGPPAREEKKMVKLKKERTRDGQDTSWDCTTWKDEWDCCNILKSLFYQHSENLFVILSKMDSYVPHILARCWNIDYLNNTGNLT